MVGTVRRYSVRGSTGQNGYVVHRVFVLRAATLTAVAFLLVLLAASRHDAAPWQGTAAPVVAAQAASPNVPTWQASYAARFPGCRPGHALAPRVLVMDQDARVSRMETGRAFAVIASKNPATRLWVLGTCGR